MKDTHKIKTAIKLLREIDAESKNNYFTINKTKYFVNKNLLFKNGVQVGSIKNGVIIFNKPLIKSRKATMTKGTRKFRSTFNPVNKSISNTMRIKPVVNGSIPTYNPLMSNFSEPMEEPEPVTGTQEPEPEPVTGTQEPEPVTGTQEPEAVSEPEEPFDEHKEDL